MPIPIDEIERVIEERNQAHRRGDFRTAARLRDDLLVKGIVLEDGTLGTSWRLKEDHDEE